MVWKLILSYTTLHDYSLLKSSTGVWGGVLDQVTVRQAVATLQDVVNLPGLILELDHPPGVTALHLGVIGPGQVPGDALGLLLLFCPLNRTLHDTIIKWIFLEQLEVSLIRKQTSSPFWINIFDSMIRTVTGCFIHCRLQYYIKSPDEGWCDHNFTLMSWWQGYLAAAKVAGCVFWRSNQNLEWP